MYGVQYWAALSAHGGGCLQQGGGAPPDHHQGHHQQFLDRRVNWLLTFADQCCGSVSFWYGSGSKKLVSDPDPGKKNTDPDSGKKGLSAGKS